MKLLPDDSTAVRVLGLAEEGNIFIWAGCLSFVALAPFGVMTFFVLDTLKVVRGINLVAGSSTFVGVSIIPENLGEKASLSGHGARLLLLARPWASSTLRFRNASRFFRLSQPGGAQLVSVMHLIHNFVLHE